MGELEAGLKLAVESASDRSGTESMVNNILATIQHIAASSNAHSERIRSVAGTAETMRHAVELLRLEHADNPGGVVTISLGGATSIPGHEDRPEALLRKADEALYRAKAEGRNRVVWADEGLAPAS